jgi:ElaB/YqjD/DUF883 family membrane-anchored ribosome-binding protein
MTGPGNQGSSFGGQQHYPGTGTHPSTGHRPEDTGVGGAASAVKDKAKDLGSSAANLAGQVKDTARDWASSAAGSAQQAWESTRQQAQNVASDVAHRAENAWDDVNSFVRRNPFPALLCALGVGFLLGGFLGFGSRRSSY